VRLLRELGGLYVAGRQFDRAISAFNRARDIAPEQAETYFGLGVAYKTAGRLREAIDAFEMAVRRDPKNANALTQLAETLYSAGEANRAVTILQQAIGINRRDPQLYYTLGQMYGANLGVHAVA
jgi:tetratricopeptide (TPR) repeat protein